MNAITLEMAGSLVEIARRVELAATRDEIRAVVLQGAGDRAFCTGADLKQRNTMTQEQLWRHADLIRQFGMSCYRGSVPVIAAIHGFCLGGGLEIAVACDLRIAAESASLGFTEARIGAFPGAGGAVFTPRLVGVAVAKDLLYTGRRVRGDEAFAIGLVNRVVPDDALRKTANEMAGTIAANGPLAVRALKKLLNHGPEIAVDDAFALSDALRRPLNATEDYAEGLAAFAQRRSPVFLGR
jgi:enoyl-CoA hydratase/carnithine racemase